jgi:3-oxoacyl-[acyl-carrier protein] reductase
MTLKGKTAIVTGAAGTIGSAIAESLVEAGVHVVLVDIAEANLRSQTERLGAGATATVVDLSKDQAVQDAADGIKARFGIVDILVNNAGILSNNKCEQTDLEEWRRIHAVNVDAAFLLTKSVLPGMRHNRWGRIINISSYAWKSGGLTAGTSYSVSKSALVGLTFSIARETAAQGITSNAIAPAYVMSPMVSEQLSEDQRRTQLLQIPVGRFCQPVEVAHAVMFLASPLAGFITGEVIDMNGGLQFD